VSIFFSKREKKDYLGTRKKGRHRASRVEGKEIDEEAPLIQKVEKETVVRKDGKENKLKSEKLGQKTNRRKNGETRSEGQKKIPNEAKKRVRKTKKEELVGRPKYGRGRVRKCGNLNKIKKTEGEVLWI